MSDALVGIQEQVDKLAQLDSEQLAGTAPGFARFMEIKFQTHECYKELADGEYAKASEILSLQHLAEVEQRYGTVR